MKFPVKSIMAALAIVTVTSASAVPLPAQLGSFPGGGGTTSTNFVSQPVVPNFVQFDPLLGTLNSVTIGLTGLVTGSAQAESLDAAPTTVTLTLQALVEFLVGPTSLVQVIPAVSSVANLTAFDGTIDFGGTSGISFTGLSGSDNSSVVLTGAALAPWIGTGTVTGLCSGTGQSTGSGAGNLVTIFSTQAGCDVTVSYDYTPSTTVDAVPEIDAISGTGALTLLAGVLAVVGERRRRRT